jgi:A/G-specific adenine glycosylase
VSARARDHFDDSIAIYTQGLMDLGAQLCTRSKPHCKACPLNDDCAALARGLVAQLPTPRPRKTLPEKHSVFLLLLSGCDILLEKRPGSGIWGGLWCPPQLDEGLDISAYCARHFDFDVAQATVLPVFSHTFTHFKLHISPLVVQIAKSNTIEKHGRIWMDLNEALRAAIPTPVRKLLQTLLKSR